MNFFLLVRFWAILSASLITIKTINYYSLTGKEGGETSRPRMFPQRCETWSHSRISHSRAFTSLLLEHNRAGRICWRRRTRQTSPVCLRGWRWIELVVSLHALFGFWNWNWDSALSRIVALPVFSWRNYCLGRGNSLHPTWTEGCWSRISGSWRWTGHRVLLCSYFSLSKKLKTMLVVVCLPDRVLFLQTTVHFPVPAGQQWVWPWKALTTVHSGSCWSINSCWHIILFLPFFSRHSSFQQ